MIQATKKMIENYERYYGDLGLKMLIIDMDIKQGKKRQFNGSEKYLVINTYYRKVRKNGKLSKKVRRLKSYEVVNSAIKSSV